MQWMRLVDQDLVDQNYRYGKGETVAVETLDEWVLLFRINAPQ